METGGRREGKRTGDSVFVKVKEKGVREQRYNVAKKSERGEKQRERQEAGGGDLYNKVRQRS